MESYGFGNSNLEGTVVRDLIFIGLVIFYFLISIASFILGNIPEAMYLVVSAIFLLVWAIFEKVGVYTKMSVIKRSRERGGE